MKDELMLEELEEMWNSKPIDEPEYAVIPVDGVAKTVRLDSPEFKKWLSSHDAAEYLIDPCQTSIKT